MGRILVASLPYAGHATPLAAVAEALVARGHEVVAYTSGRYLERFERIGAAPLPWDAAPAFDDTTDATVFPRMVKARGPLAPLFMLLDVVIGTAAAQTRDILAAHERAPFDVAVSDVFAMGSALFSKRTGVPFVTVDPMARARQSAATFATMRLLLDRPLRRQFAALGMPTQGVTYWGTVLSPDLVLSPNAPLLEYPGTPARYRLVGRLAPQSKEAPAFPDWWPTVRDSGHPIVLVSQGSLHTQPQELILPTIRALAGRGVIVVATTGGGPLEALGELPGNARAAQWLPIAAMLPHVSAFVSNGGWGSVLESLEAGVPLVVAGTDVDKPLNAARVAWAGAGLDLRTRRPSETELRLAVDSALRAPSFRERAQAIGAELRSLGGATRAAELIEALL